MRTVIFDLDGTLADTSGDLAAAANATLAAIGLGTPIDAEADRRVTYLGGRAMLRLGAARAGAPAFADAELDRHYLSLIGHYGAALDRHTRLFPGVLDALDRLADDGWRLGICTNKPAHLAEDLLVRLGVRPRFASMIGADTLPVRKPDPAPLIESIARAGGRTSHAALVGDTLTDRETARRAGIPSILVTFGGDGPEEVARHAPEALIDDFAALDAALARLVPL